MKSKNDRVKEAEELAEGLHVLFSEMVDEVGDASKSSRKSKKELKDAKASAAKAHAAYVEHKLLSNLLKDEVRDAQVDEVSSREKVEQYSEIIEYLSRELEEQQREFDEILTFIDAHACDGDIAGDNMLKSPNVIAKHYVPNKRGKGAVTFMIIADSNHHI